MVMVINLIPMCMWTYTWVHWTYKLKKICNLHVAARRAAAVEESIWVPSSPFNENNGSPIFFSRILLFLSKCNRSPKIAFMNFFLLASVILWKPFLPPPFLPNLRSRTHNFLEMMETTKTFYFTKLNFSAHTPYPFYFKNTSCNRCLIRKYNRKP